MPLDGGLLSYCELACYWRIDPSLLEVRNLARLCQTLSTCLRVSEAQRLDALWILGRGGQFVNPISIRATRRNDEFIWSQ